MWLAQVLQYIHHYRPLLFPPLNQNPVVPSDAGPASDAGQAAPPLHRSQLLALRCAGPQYTVQGDDSLHEQVHWTTDIREQIGPPAEHVSGGPVRNQSYNFKARYSSVLELTSPHHPH
jgi:hypothetical protein